MELQIHELVGANHSAVWQPWAVQYFFLIAASATALFLTLPAFVLRRERALPLGRLAMLSAVTTGLAAPIALLADLHEPNRFWHFYAYFQTSSWMAWGAWIVPSYVIALIAYAWAAYRPELAELGEDDWRFAWLFRLLSLKGSRNAFTPAIGAVAALLGVAVLTYTGAEIFIIRARPLWNTPLLPLQLFTTGFVASIGVMLVLNALMLRDKALEISLNRYLLVALACVGLLGAVWFFLALTGLDPVNAEALQSVAGFPVWHSVATWAVLAIAIPFAIALVKPGGTGLVTGLIAIHAAWMFRWTVFMGGQSVPKVGSGLYDALLPQGLHSLMGVIGTFGLWIFLIIAFTTFIPWTRAGIPGTTAGVPERTATFRKASQS
ncbi:NrfD/PsrC family molybdoenzyme membrane anchor subunit [Breoghania sp.]|uniref:NrfD/PsrC family molybdoenzyme membrane anchor subunit n=1 Tax=Breoghania sp. TaxID=2065378 RepID=UPI002AA60073|nr:NrfD/PsrC family molybdoenzyme membrane anchor subunit [Breoghania sp.]